MSGGVGSVFRGIGDMFTGGMFTAKRQAKKARKEGRKAQKELDRIADQERTNRRNLQRAAVAESPSLFDLLRGPSDQ